MKKGDLVEFSIPVIDGGIGIVMENSTTGVRVFWLTGGMTGMAVEYTASRILKNLT
jgi:hypothetical protein